MNESYSPRYVVSCYLRYERAVMRQFRDNVGSLGFLQIFRGKPVVELHQLTVTLA